MIEREAVFISHAEGDRAFAGDLCALLEREGRRCWIAPRDIAPGTQYGAAIMAAIQASGAMLVVLSQAANASRFVAREVERAASLGRRLLVVRAEEVLPGPDLALFLSDTQWIDAFALDEAALRQRLLQGLESAVTAPSPHRPRRRSGTVIALAAAAIVIGLVFWFWPRRSPPAATPQDFARQFFALQDAGRDEALMGLFSERSRAQLTSQQWQASFAAVRAQTANVSRERRFIGELHWNARATNYQDAGAVSVLTERAFGELAVCEVLGLRPAAGGWQAESYIFWPSQRGPCLGEADLQAPGRRARELAARIAANTLDREADIVAALQPLSRDGSWTALLQTTRTRLPVAGASDVLVVLPGGYLPLPGGVPIPGRYALVRLAADGPQGNNNLDLTLQLDADGVWRLAAPPMLYPLSR